MEEMEDWKIGIMEDWLHFFHSCIRAEKELDSSVTSFAFRGF